MRSILRTLAAGLAAFALCLPASATVDEEVCGACDAKVVISGQFQHGTSDTFLIANAPGNEAAYRDEVLGTNFVLSVPGLKAGKYTLEIGLVELKSEQAGQRLFDILCGGQAIATNVDIFAAADGMDRVWRLRAAVDHLGDAAHGPLCVQFIARRDLAKLNTFDTKYV
jgi:Malectin domain